MDNLWVLSFLGVNSGPAGFSQNNFISPWETPWWNQGKQATDKTDINDRWYKRQADPSIDPEALKVAAKQTELQTLLQQIYQAEAAVKMETGEVTRTQQVAMEAEQTLEEATNKVRMLSSDLQNAQEAAAQAAMRAHTAQLQLSAHDQLMFTARQRVDALSAQMVSVQADLAAVQQMFTLSNSSQHLEQQARALQFGPENLEQLQAVAPEAQLPPGYINAPQDTVVLQVPNAKYPWLNTGYAANNNADLPKRPYGY